ncbi:MAG: hypothetical protein IJ689_05955, partial [Alphaproteobacteria bacterium]|nr:hypothetical protein [Alphaproteobacteria bacterium]
MNNINENYPPLRPLTAEQLAQAKILAQQIRPQNSIWDDIADVGRAFGKGVLSGTESVLNGASLGAYRFLGDKAGLGVSERAQELQDMADTAGVGGLNKAAQFASEMAGGFRGPVAKGLEFARAGLTPISPRLANTTVAPLLVSGATESAISNTFNHDFNNWDQIGKDTLQGTAQSLIPWAAGKGAGKIGSYLLNKAGYQQFLDKYAKTRVMDAQPRNPIKDSWLYGDVVPDNTPVNMIHIDKAPRFKKISDLRRILSPQFDNIGGRTNLHTKEYINTAGTAARVIKNAKIKENVFAYPKIDEVIEQGLSSGIRPTDAFAKHQGVSGQKIYNAGITYGSNNTPYSTRFYVDQPNDIASVHNFAGIDVHKIKGGRGNAHTVDALVPEGVLRSNTPLNATPFNYNIGDLRGPVNPEFKNISNLYDGLNKKQVIGLDNAIKSGAKQSVNPMGSFDNMLKIRSQVGTQSGLNSAKKQLDGILDTAEKKLGLPSGVQTLRKGVDKVNELAPKAALSISHDQPQKWFTKEDYNKMSEEDEKKNMPLITSQILLEKEGKIPQYLTKGM